MRIIGGKYRGRVLTGFKGWDIRPTSDRVKESLFNILAPEISGANVLDLFCGSGSVGLEAISRGADLVVFNDASKDSLAVLKKNPRPDRSQCARIQSRFQGVFGTDRHYFRHHLYRPAVQERVGRGGAAAHCFAAASEYGRRGGLGERQARLRAR